VEWPATGWVHPVIEELILEFHVVIN
jgi:hypothetical protein